jgi:hypothetical protein
MIASEYAMVGQEERRVLRRFAKRRLEHKIVGARFGDKTLSDPATATDGFGQALSDSASAYGGYGKNFRSDRLLSGQRGSSASIFRCGF